MEVVNQVKVDVVDVRMKGEIGAKLREGDQMVHNVEAKIVSMAERQVEENEEEIEVKISEIKVYENQREDDEVIMGMVLKRYSLFCFLYGGDMYIFTIFNVLGRCICLYNKVRDFTSTILYFYTVQ